MQQHVDSTASAVQVAPAGLKPRDAAEISFRTGVDIAQQASGAPALSSSGLKAARVKCSSIQIGRWSASLQSLRDLQLGFHYARKKLVIELTEERQKRRIEIAWKDICALRVKLLDPGAAGESILEIDLTGLPTFHIKEEHQPGEDGRKAGWLQCLDFTGGHALTCKTQRICAQPGLLNTSLEKLLRCDARLRSLAAGAAEPPSTAYSPSSAAPIPIPSPSPSPGLSLSLSSGMRRESLSVSPGSAAVAPLGGSVAGATGSSPRVGSRRGQSGTRGSRTSRGSLESATRIKIVPGGQSPVGFLGLAGAGTLRRSGSFGSGGSPAASAGQGGGAGLYPQAAHLGSSPTLGGAEGRSWSLERSLLATVRTAGGYQARVTTSHAGLANSGGRTPGRKRRANSDGQIGLGSPESRGSGRSVRRAGSLSEMQVLGSPSPVEQPALFSRRQSASDDGLIMPGSFGSTQSLMSVSGPTIELPAGSAGAAGDRFPSPANLAWLRESPSPVGNRGGVAKEGGIPAAPGTWTSRGWGAGDTAKQTGRGPLSNPVGRPTAAELSTLHIEASLQFESRRTSAGSFTNPTNPPGNASAHHSHPAPNPGEPAPQQWDPNLLLHPGSRAATSAVMTNSLSQLSHMGSMESMYTQVHLAGGNSGCGGWSIGQQLAGPVPPVFGPSLSMPASSGLVGAAASQFALSYEEAVQSMSRAAAAAPSPAAQIPEQQQQQPTLPHRQFMQQQALQQQLQQQALHQQLQTQLLSQQQLERRLLAEQQLQERLLTQQQQQQRQVPELGLQDFFGPGGLEQSIASSSSAGDEVDEALAAVARMQLPTPGSSQGIAQGGSGDQRLSGDFCGGALRHSSISSMTDVGGFVASGSGDFTGGAVSAGAVGVSGGSGRDSLMNNSGTALAAYARVAWPTEAADQSHLQGPRATPLNPTWQGYPHLATAGHRYAPAPTQALPQGSAGLATVGHRFSSLAQPATLGSAAMARPQAAQNPHMMSMDHSYHGLNAAPTPDGPSLLASACPDQARATQLGQMLEGWQMMAAAVQMPESQMFSGGGIDVGSSPGGERLLYNAGALQQASPGAAFGSGSIGGGPWVSGLRPGDPQWRHLGLTTVPGAAHAQSGAGLVMGDGVDLGSFMAAAGQPAASRRAGPPASTEVLGGAGQAANLGMQSREAALLSAQGGLRGLEGASGVVEPEVAGGWGGGGGAMGGAAAWVEPEDWLGTVLSSLSGPQDASFANLFLGI